MKKTMNLLVGLLVLCLVLALTLNVLFIAGVIPGTVGPQGATGTNGTDGKDGLTPRIGEDGNWWIGDTNTGIKAEGAKGEPGTSGTSGDDGLSAYEIYKKYTKDDPVKSEEEWLESLKGTDGENGKTPKIEIKDGFWWINDENTGVKAVPDQWIQKNNTLPDPEDVIEGDYCVITYSSSSFVTGVSTYRVIGGQWVLYESNTTPISSEELKQQSEFHINTLDELKAFRDSVNGGMNYSGKKVYLDADIDLLSEENWTPIGNNNNPFKGTFEGTENGRTISNLTITEPEGTSINTTKYFGLFGKADVALKNFTIKNVTIYAPHCNYIAAVVATAQVPTIEKVNVIGNISIDGFRWVGGIVGNGYANVSECRVEQTSGTGIAAYYQKAGGIAGQLNASKVEDCYVKATIRAGKLNGTGNYGTLGSLIGGMDGTGAPVVSGNEVHVVIDASLVEIYHDPENNTDTNYGIFTGALVGNPGGAKDTPCMVTKNFGEVTVITNNVAVNGLGLVGRGSATTVADDNEVTVTWDGEVVTQTLTLTVAQVRKQELDEVVA